MLIASSLCSYHIFLITTQCQFCPIQSYWVCRSKLVLKNISLSTDKFVYICDQACENQPSEHEEITDFSSLLYHNLRNNYLYYHNEIFITTAEFSLLQNLIGFLLQLAKMGYYILNGRYQQKYNSVYFVLTWLIKMQLK